MSLTKDYVNSELQNLSVRNNIQGVLTAAEKHIQQRAALLTSSFSETPTEEEVAGFTSLTSDEVPIVQLTNDPAGARALQSLSDQSDLQTLTGSTMDPALGAEVFCLATPQAATAAVANLLSVPISQVTSVGVAVASPELKDLVASTIISNASSAISTRFGAALNLYSTNFIAGITKGFNQPVKDVVESKTKNLFNAISTYADRRNPPVDISNNVAQLIDLGQFKAAALLVEPYSTYDVSVIETAFSELDLTVAGNLN